MGKYDCIEIIGVYDYSAGDRHGLGRSPARILLALAGLDDETLWTERGPSRRASWIKGYLHRGEASAGLRRRGPVQALSRREKTMLLVAFDIWNGTGAVPFTEILNLPPRLVRAVAGVMEASVSDDPDALGGWMSRWSFPDARLEN